MASMASAMAGPLLATAPAAATPRLSRSFCRGFVRRRSGRPQRLRGRLQWRGAGSTSRPAPMTPGMRELVSAPHGTRLCTCLRSPGGSAQFLDADKVARGIAEGAVANAVRLLGRLLDDLG